MKKALLSLVALLCTAIAWADNFYLENISQEEGTLRIEHWYPDQIHLEYSNDNASWNVLNVGEEYSVAPGKKVYLRATAEGNEGFNNGGRLRFNQKCNLGGDLTTILQRSGNVETLIDYAFSYFFEYLPVVDASKLILPSKVIGTRAYENMFQQCMELTAAPTIKAMELGAYACTYMFYGCTSLTEAPALPATSLNDYCYDHIFYGCTSLTKAPVLPATELKYYCYNNMFASCTSLTKAPELPSTTLAQDCYNNMFCYCTALTEAPELPATEMAIGCYNSMFSYSGLTKTPALPATQLADWCYNFMFGYCESLQVADIELPATTMAHRSCCDMFNGCVSLTKAPLLPATEMGQECYMSMFSGCTALTEAPALPATKLAEGCYNNMFSSSGITKAPALPATQLAPMCYNSMFWNCQYMVGDIELPAETLPYYAYSGMFNNSKIENIKLGLNDWSGTATDGWLENTNATVYCLPSLTIIRDYSHFPEHVTVKNWYDFSKSAVSLSGLQDGVVYEVPQGKTVYTPAVAAAYEGTPIESDQYTLAYNGKDLKELAPGTYTVTATALGMNVGQKSIRITVVENAHDVAQAALLKSISAANTAKAALVHEAVAADLQTAIATATAVAEDAAAQTPAIQSATIALDAAVSVNRNADALTTVKENELKAQAAALAAEKAAALAAQADSCYEDKVKFLAAQKDSCDNAKQLALDAAAADKAQAITDLHAEYAALELTKYAQISLSLAGQSKSQLTVKKGEVAIAIMPEADWAVSTITMNGNDVTGSYTGGALNVNVEADAAIDVTFRWADEASLYTEDNATDMGAIHTKAGIYVYSEGDKTCIEGAYDTDITVYTVAGALVTRQHNGSDRVVLSLPAGTYIIKAGAEAIKVSVK